VGPGTHFTPRKRVRGHHRLLEQGSQEPEGSQDTFVSRDQSPRTLLCPVTSLPGQNCRPDCTIKYRFLFDSALYDPLSITSLYGSPAMLRYMIESSDFNKDKFLTNPAMGAADQILQWGDLPRLRILFLGSNTGHQLRNLGFFRLIMKQWCISDTHRPGWDVVFDLIDDVLDILVKERWGNELLCMAASMGCMPIIRRLMDRAQHKAGLRTDLLRRSQRAPQTRSFGKPVHQSIGEAVLGNHVDIVEYLLGQEGIETHLP
jgi:hypothetical protein